MNATTVGLASILESALQLDSPFNFSSVVPDINYTTPTALRANLYPSSVVAAASVPQSLVGIAHTRLAAPDKPMRFKVRPGMRIACVWALLAIVVALTAWHAVLMPH